MRTLFHRRTLSSLPCSSRRACSAILRPRSSVLTLARVSVHHATKGAPSTSSLPLPHRHGAVLCERPNSTRSFAYLATSRANNKVHRGFALEETAPRRQQPASP
jgi:hypothetical protein